MLTATLSPGSSSPAKAARIRRREPAPDRVDATSSPTASTRPVNISFNQHVFAERLDPTLDEGSQREARVINERDTTRS